MSKLCFAEGRSEGVSLGKERGEARERRSYGYLLLLIKLGSCFFCSAAVEAELSKQNFHLRGPEELQQATSFLHDNGTKYLPSLLVDTEHSKK